MELEVGRHWSASLNCGITVLLLPISVPYISVQTPKYGLNCTGTPSVQFVHSKKCDHFQCVFYLFFVLLFQTHSASTFTNIWPFLSVCLSLSFASESQPLCKLSKFREGWLLSALSSYWGTKLYLFLHSHVALKQTTQYCYNCSWVMRVDRAALMCFLKVAFVRHVYAVCFLQRIGHLLRKILNYSFSVLF